MVRIVRRLSSGTIIGEEETVSAVSTVSCLMLPGSRGLCNNWSRYHYNSLHTATPH